MPDLIELDPMTAEPAQLAEALRAGVNGRDRLERAAVHLLTGANEGDLLDLDRVRRTIRRSGTGHWRVLWHDLAGDLEIMGSALSGAGEALTGIACALAAGSVLTRLNYALTTLDLRNRLLVADAIAIAAGAYAAPPLAPAGEPFRAVDVALWVQRMLGLRGQTQVHGDTSAAWEEPVIEVQLPDGRGTFMITVAYPTQHALDAAADMAPAGE